VWDSGKCSTMKLQCKPVQNVQNILFLMPRRALSDAAICPSLRLSVCLSWHMSLRQKRCVLGIWNTKPHAGSRTHRSAWLYNHRKRPKWHWPWKIYVVNISITKTDRATILHNHRYRLITGKDRTRLSMFSAKLSTVSCHWPVAVLFVILTF